MRQLRAFVPLLVLIAIGVAVAASGMLQHLAPDRIVADQAMWSHEIALHRTLSYVIYVVVLTLSVATAMPGPLLVIIAGGMLFGMGPAIGLSLVGEVLGSLLLFYAARYAFGAGHRPPPRIADRVRRGYQNNPVSYTFFVRLVPLFPFGAITVALAWLRCPLWLFTLSTAFGGVVMLVFETAIGAGVGHSIANGQGVSPSMFLHPQVWLPVLGLALLALVPIAVQRWRQTQSSK